MWNRLALTASADGNAIGAAPARGAYENFLEAFSAARIETSYIGCEGCENAGSKRSDARFAFRIDIFPNRVEPPF